MIYTSGSTGRPKGVVIEHRQTVAMLTWAGQAFGVGALAETLASTSVCFDLSVFEIFAPLSVGATVTLAAGNALDLIEDRAGFGHVTLVNTVPSAAAELLAAGAIPPRAGAIGEVYLSGSGVTRGYHQRPGLTAERYLPLPDDEGGRLYRTGDLARWRPSTTADGGVEFFLDYHGRVDHQVKLRGFRIEPGEVEHALLQHPAVSEAVVTVHGDHLIAHIASKNTPTRDHGNHAQGDERAHDGHSDHTSTHDMHGGRPAVAADHGDLALCDADCEQILLRYLRG
ncbi:AMP-binding protein, partial [Microbispora triticiradicis]|uniref:AMP-binding protein n=1 Tax=Microbispora triticiradicis TaxID=2200763 RepID=UPI001AD82FD4